MKCLKLVIQSPSVKHIIIIINVSINLCAGQGKLQLFPFCSAVCSGWVRLAPQFGTRLEFPHSEMRAGHRLKLFHMMRWDSKIGGETGRAPSLHVPFHSPPADWSAKAEWKSEKIILLFFFFLHWILQTNRQTGEDGTSTRTNVTHAREWPLCAGLLVYRGNQWVIFICVDLDSFFHNVFTSQKQEVRSLSSGSWSRRVSLHNC